MGSLSFVMCFSKFIIQQSILYVILFYKKLVKWCSYMYLRIFTYLIFIICYIY